ncbi:exodeoxyribonuclease VII large subunit [Granulosicoccus antarcticus]|uniref:exodeoxyribonuclease VII large subunit n=1 Tax=Granulosicoccus antarcticus TaxID=437505 RepID=UPI001F0155C2|nr:exodeoxyribonuclease VII large subunit [Granulosicoccus antarcticus]
MDKKIFTVSRLNQEVQRLLETGFGTLWLQGELSNFSRPASGHFYFTLKDSQAQIRCAMFKGRNRYIDFQPENGEAVIVRGKLGLYAARGDYQLIVEHMEPAGAGKLQAAFEATKRKLDELGWFSQDLKQTVPALPRTIGVVTSPTGAALRDVLQVLARRYRQADIIIYPTLTQGAAAAPAIVRALQQANRRAETDVLLLVRGGGSLEDLWAFNEVAVAEAIKDSVIPVVAGIGHEVDITISDLVADLRAPTPSAAAELATPDGNSLQHRVSAASKALYRANQARLDDSRQRLNQQLARLHLRHPERRLREQAQRADELEMRLTRAWDAQKQRRMSRQQALRARLEASSPAVRLARHQALWQAMEARMRVAIGKRQDRARSRFEIMARALHAVSPLGVLERGYALVRKDGNIVSQVSSLQPGDKITTRLSNGEFSAIVSSTDSLKP